LSGGVVPGVVCLNVIEEHNRGNLGALGLSSHKKSNIYISPTADAEARGVESANVERRGRAMANKNLPRMQRAKSHIGSITGLWLLPDRPLGLNTNE